MPGGNTIPTAPGSSVGNPPSPPATSSGNPGGGTPGASSGGSRGKSGGGGSSYNPYAYAERKEREANRKAARRYLEQAATLQQQIDALRIALGRKGFRKQLRQKLENVSLSMRQADKELMRGYRTRVGSLEQTSEDNLKAGAGQTIAALANRSRERANALSEAMATGAGESDVLRAQEMSLRNWQANQSEVNRSFYDTKSSISASLADLTTDTRSARVSNVAQANADREQLWTNYYDQRSETLTQLGNTLGQQAEYYSLANEARASKRTNRKRKRAAAASGNAFEQASRTAGRAYDSPGVSKKLRKWTGAEDFEGRLNNSKFSSAPTELALSRPEGATLRKWET